MEESKPLPSITTVAITEQQVRESTVQVDPLPIVYFNQCRLTVTFTDVRLFLGQNMATSSGQPKFTEDLCVVFTPEYAKTISDILVAAMNMYEEKFGKLRPRPTPTPTAAPPPTSK